MTFDLFTMRSILLPYAFVWEKYAEFQTTSPLEPLGQFCTNFIWSLLRLGEWKIAKMVPVHWPRRPPCPYMVKTFKNLLLQNIGDRGSTKVAKIMVIQVCFPMHLYGKKHLKILFSKISHKDALWLNLCIYYWEHLYVCSGYVTQVSEPWPVGLLFFLTGLYPFSKLWPFEKIWMQSCQQNISKTIEATVLKLDE